MYKKGESSMKHISEYWNPLVLFTLSVAFLLAPLSGCDLQPAQTKTIAQQAGLFSVVGWIAVDNPSPEVLIQVKRVVGTIQENSKDVQAGQTYTEVLYPALVSYIDSNLESNYKPLAKTGALSILGGIDMLFAAHPDWKKNQETAIGIVDSFCLGAQNGLSMQANDPTLLAARRTAVLRSNILMN